MYGLFYLVNDVEELSLADVFMLAGKSRTEYAPVELFFRKSPSEIAWDEPSIEAE